MLIGNGRWGKSELWNLLQTISIEMRKLENHTPSSSSFSRFPMYYSTWKVRNKFITQVQPPPPFFNIEEILGVGSMLELLGLEENHGHTVGAEGGSNAVSGLGNGIALIFGHNYPN